jgi:hypothetical protein
MQGKAVRPLFFKRLAEHTITITEHDCFAQKESGIFMLWTRGKPASIVTIFML